MFMLTINFHLSHLEKKKTRPGSSYWSLALYFLAFFTSPRCLPHGVRVPFTCKLSLSWIPKSVHPCGRAWIQHSEFQKWAWSPLWFHCIFSFLLLFLSSGWLGASLVPQGIDILPNFPTSLALYHYHCYWTWVLHNLTDCLELRSSLFPVLRPAYGTSRTPSIRSHSY